MRTRLAAALVPLLVTSAAAQDEGPKTSSFPTSARITDIAVSPDGSRLYLADYEGQIWIHAADGKELGRLVEHKARLDNLAFVGADPSLLVTSSRTEFVRTWDAAVGVVRRRFTLPGNPPSEELDQDGWYIPTWEHVFAVAAARDTPTIAIASPNHRVEFWDLATDRSAGGFTFAGYAFAAAFSPDASKLALSVAADEGVDPAVEVFRAAGGPPLWKDGVHEKDSDPKAREHSWYGLAFSPDGKSLLAWGWRSKGGKSFGGLRLHDAATGARKWTVLYDFGVWEAAFSPGGDRIAMSSKHGVSLFDPATGEEVIGLESKSDSMNDIAFSPDGRWLYGALRRADGILRWDLAGEVTVVEPVRPRSGKVVSKPPAAGTPTSTSTTAPAPDARKAAIDHGARVSSMALSPDGARLATGGKDGAVRVFDVASGARSAEFTGLGEVKWVSWLGPDANGLATAGTDGVVRCWDVATKAKRCQFDASAKNASASASAVPTEFAASPTGREIVAGACDGTVRAFDAATGTLRASITLDEKFGKATFVPSCLAVAADGNRVVVAGADILGTTRGRVLDRNAATGAFTVVARLAGRDDDEATEFWSALTITRDGSSALGLSSATVSRGGAKRPAGILRSWDVNSGAVRWRLDLSDVPDAGALSPRGDVFAVSQKDGVRLVSIVTGKDTRTLPLPGEVVKSLVFAPTGLRLFAGTASGAVRILDVGK